MISIDDIQRVFVDTSAWIDLMNRNERHHADAVAFHKSLVPMTLRITTWGIVSETFTWIRYHVGSREASRWLVSKELLERQGLLQGLAIPLPCTSTFCRNIWSSSRAAHYSLGCR